MSEEVDDMERREIEWTSKQSAGRRGWGCPICGAAFARIFSAFTIGGIGPPALAIRGDCRCGWSGAVVGKLALEKEEPSR
jgi:hypothetical protein